MKTLDPIRSAAVAAMALLAAVGCQDDAQLLRGRVDSTDFRAPVVGVRATREGAEVATATVDGRGYFEIAVPPGRGTRLEVVTRDTAHPFVIRNGAGLAAQQFDVCGSVAPFDMGHVHGAERTDGGEPDASGDCDMPDMPPCLPGPDGSCEPPSPPSPCWCEPPSPPPCPAPGPDGTCGEPPVPCDPMDPSCGGCPAPRPDGTCGEPPVPPVPCDDPNGCGPTEPCGPDDPMGCPTPPPPECDAMGTCCTPDGTCCYPDGTCSGGQPCLPGPDGSCTDPCADGMCDPPQDCDVWVCDPCAADPMSCWPDDPTCPMDEPGCWPLPPSDCSDPGTGMDCLRTGAVPERPFLRFGCGEG